MHEADFVIAFCKYLLMQPYEPQDITILTTYSGQEFYLKQVFMFINFYYEIFST
jgi:hypothetical protein